MKNFISQNSSTQEMEVSMEEPTEISCPFCGESFTTFIDISSGNQNYIEDCQVCCRPIELRVSVSTKTGRFRVHTARD